MIDKNLESFFLDTFRNVENLLRSIDSRLQTIDEKLSPLSSIEARLDEIENNLSQRTTPKEITNEDIIQQCIKIIRDEQKASVTLLQRRMRLDYARATEIMGELERRGIVGPDKGEELRDVNK
jgi:S-DNA-T family DNA segregation ATPase FtsK/SpoIIIE